MNKKDYTDKIIDDAVSFLKDDGIIVVPTDTVYGLAIDSGSELAINKIYELKKRDQSKRLPMVFDTFERLFEYCDVDEELLSKISNYFPGKVTIVVKKKGKEDTVAVRMIKNSVINEIIRKLDRPIFLTSANISGNDTSNNIDDLLDDFDGKVDMVILGNNVSTVASTIIDLSDGNLRLIREGAVKFSLIEEVFYGKNI